MNVLKSTFIKCLGKGRAWLCGDSFTNELIGVFTSPLSDIKKYFLKLKESHFPSKNLLEENILNGETLFGISHIAENLEERANNVEIEWSMLAGNLNYKTIETALKKVGFKIKVIENISFQRPDLGTGFLFGNTQYNGIKDEKRAQFGGHFTKIIGNGFLDIEGTNKDPARFVNGKNSFYLKGFFDPSDKEWDYISEIVLKLKPLQSVAICNIAERKIVDNEWYDTTEFLDILDGGTPEMEDFFEILNP